MKITLYELLILDNDAIKNQESKDTSQGWWYIFRSEWEITKLVPFLYKVSEFYLIPCNWISFRTYDTIIIDKPRSGN